MRIPHRRIVWQVYLQGEIVSFPAQRSFDLIRASESILSCHNPLSRVTIFYDTYTRMKTTIEISNSLLEEARKLAAKERATVRALVEQGLRQIVAERKSRGAFKVRKATFKGQGLQTGFAGATWEQMRETKYEGRGG